jgi:peptidoglycan L-alanyl-D-glutamate endopeptidase CwlK
MPDELDDLLSKIPAAPKLPRVSTPAPVAASLNPQLAQQADEIAAAVKARGFDVRLGSTVRTPEGQAEKVEQGLSRTYHSRHLTGDAVDFNAYDEHGNYIKDGSHPAYAAIGEEARKRGLTWGGDFKSFHDPSHVELPRTAAPRDALDDVLDQVPASAPAAPAGDELDNLLSTLPKTDENGDEVEQINSAREVAPTPAPVAAAKLDPYTVQGRASRDAALAVETQPHASRARGATAYRVFKTLAARRSRDGRACLREVGRHRRRVHNRLAGEASGGQPVWA